MTASVAKSYQICFKSRGNEENFQHYSCLYLFCLVIITTSFISCAACYECYLLLRFNLTFSVANNSNSLKEKAKR